MAGQGPIAPAQLGSVWLAAFLYAFCQGIVFALYPPYAATRGISAFIIGLGVTALMLGRTLVFLFFRKIRGRFKALTTAGSAVMGLTILPLSLAIEPWIILPLSLTLGCGLGLIYSATIMMALSADEANRGKYAGLFESSIGAGYFFGPLVGGAAAQVALQGPYAICSGVSLISLLKIVRSEIKPSRHNRLST